MRSPGLVVLTVSLLAATGCDTVFGLGRQDAEADCSSPPLDDPRRYGYHHDRYYEVLSRAKGAAVCFKFGMDLLEVNSVEELASLEVRLASWSEGPFWIGATDEMEEGAWRSPGGCRVETFFAPGAEDGGPAENCAVVDAATGMMRDHPCISPLEPILHVACELPRLSSACLGSAQNPGDLVLDTTMMRTRSDAQAWCVAQGARLIEMNSSPELDSALAFAGATTFWLGARFDGVSWSGDDTSSCPQVFQWEEFPDVGSGDCAMMGLAGATVHACGDPAAFALCEVGP